MTTTYREFRNGDPPSIRELWDGCPLPRGFGRLGSCDFLERMLFSKPYFDRKGMILAFEDDRLVGFVHAGFGCDDKQSRLDRAMGSICMILVHPDYRRRGIGGELLRRAQQYLAERGAGVQYIGALHPVNAFYLGMYGGSELPGVLLSEKDVVDWLTKRGYQPADTCLVYQRPLADVPALDDKRTPLLRRKVEIQVEPWPMPGDWWQACLYGPMVAIRYDMAERGTNLPIGHAWVWEMDAFERNNGAPMVGVVDFEIAEPRRRQGYGKLLLYSILKHLQGQRITTVEVQTMERNAAARGLYESLGFAEIDRGHIFRMSNPLPAAAVETSTVAPTTPPTRRARDQSDTEELHLP